MQIIRIKRGGIGRGVVIDRHRGRIGRIQAHEKIGVSLRFIDHHVVNGNPGITHRCGIVLKNGGCANTIQRGGVGDGRQRQVESLGIFKCGIVGEGDLHGFGGLTRREAQ